MSYYNGHNDPHYPSNRPGGGRPYSPGAEQVQRRYSPPVDEYHHQQRQQQQRMYSPARRNDEYHYHQSQQPQQQRVYTPEAAAHNAGHTYGYDTVTNKGPPQSQQQYHAPQYNTPPSQRPTGGDRSNTDSFIYQPPKHQLHHPTPTQGYYHYEGDGHNDRGDGGGPLPRTESPYKYGHNQQSDVSLDNYFYPPHLSTKQTSKYQSNVGAGNSPRQQPPSQQHGRTPHPPITALAIPPLLSKPGTTTNEVTTSAVAAAAAVVTTVTKTSGPQPQLSQYRTAEAIVTDDPNVVALDLPSGVDPVQEVGTVTVSQSSDGNLRATSLVPKPPVPSNVLPSVTNTAAYKASNNNNGESSLGGTSYPYHQPQQSSHYVPLSYPPYPSTKSPQVKRHKSMKDRYQTDTSGGECGCGECCSACCGGCCYTLFTCCGRCTCKVCGILCCPVLIIITILLLAGTAVALYFNWDKITHKT